MGFILKKIYKSISNHVSKSGFMRSFSLSRYGKLHSIGCPSQSEGGLLSDATSVSL